MRAGHLAEKVARCEQRIADDGRTETHAQPMFDRIKLPWIRKRILDTNDASPARGSLTASVTNLDTCERRR